VFSIFLKSVNMINLWTAGRRRQWVDILTDLPLTKSLDEDVIVDNKVGSIFFDFVRLLELIQGSQYGQEIKGRDER
jgi:hypothetical protein